MSLTSTRCCARSSSATGAGSWTRLGVRAALEDPDTAYVLLTRNGRRTRPEPVAKLIG